MQLVTRHTSHITLHTSHVTRHTSHITHHTSHVTHHGTGLADDAIADVGSCKLLLSRQCLDEEKDKAKGSSSSSSSSAPSENTTTFPSLLCPFESSTSSSSSTPLHAALRLCHKLSSDALPTFPSEMQCLLLRGASSCQLLELFCISRKQDNAGGGGEGGEGSSGKARVRHNVSRRGDVSHGHLSDAEFTRMCETGNLLSSSS